MSSSREPRKGSHFRERDSPEVQRVHLFDGVSIEDQKSIIIASDESQLYHNQFYDAIHSGKVDFLSTLIDKCPKDLVDDVLSRSYEELKLKNVPLPEEMEIFVENKLINIRLFSDFSEYTKNSLNNIKERVRLLIECISSLRGKYLNSKKVDDKFLFIAKFVAQNIHVLKCQLLSTYDRLPWEEIEFCLICFISSQTKRQELNLFYDTTLNKNKILNHLVNFAKKLKEEVEIIEDDMKFSVPTKETDRDKIAKVIIRSDSQFEQLYEDYQKIRDICSLQKINSYISLALSADYKEKEGELIILRSLQVIGEYMKNTLESPKLSKSTTELLLRLAPKETSKVLKELRDSLSHGDALTRRTEIEETADANFFYHVQNDIKKIGYVINYLFHNKKLEEIRKLLEKIACCEDLNEINKMAGTLSNSQLTEMILRRDVLIKEHEKIEELITELKNNIKCKTKFVKKLFKSIHNIISYEKNSNLVAFKSDYALQSMDFIFGNKRIDSEGASQK